MDRPRLAEDDLRGALRDLRLTNRLLGGRRALLLALRPWLRAAPRVGQAASLVLCALLTVACAGLTVRRNADWSSRERIFRDTVAKNPSSHRAHADLASVYILQNNLEAAIAHLRRAVALQPEQARSLRNLARACRYTGRYDEAIESARKAVSLGPNSADAYVNLAIVFMFSGRPDEALAAMETALRLNPRPFSGVYGYYGAVLFMNRQYEKAIEPLEKARESSYLARQHLAMAYAQLGRLDDAKVEIDSLLKAVPEDCLSFYRIYYAHHKREADRAHMIEALRKAGLPE